ncbi:hypothetical protein M422DRAFT_261120 [Sphaerobolus stellatus SS14]|uniref:Restriction of telomere capping protein 4 n=1 Tax=Sphaerobolus stellatus (strain SS14) TaxID=990650 RepID=A0A0C9VGU4_SPHS4|nr:hypothetical protein M422DRAFT_261120 [Sphaerobolus stellatus SS14]
MEVELQQRDDFSKWPQDIDFSGLAFHVKMIANELYEIIEDPNASPHFKKIIEQFKNSNSVRACSARGQFARIDHFHAGYYGERGAIIIAETLNELFPNAEISSERMALGNNITAIHPLTRMEFIEYVLVIEAALLLIADDLKVDAEKAEEIWAASGTYGRERYPLSDEEIQKWVIRHSKQMDFSDLEDPVKPESLHRVPASTIKDDEVVIIE